MKCGINLTSFGDDDALAIFIILLYYFYIELSELA